MKTASRDRSAHHYHDFPGRRWLVVALRVLHLVGLVGVGAGVVGAGAARGEAVYLGLLVGSGVAMVGLDWWASRDYPLQLAGATMGVKLLLLVWLASVPAHRPALFWSVLALSAVVSHAPARFRHRMLLGGTPAARQRVS